MNTTLCVQENFRDEHAAFDAYGVSDFASVIKTNKFVFATFGLYATPHQYIAHP